MSYTKKSHTKLYLAIILVVILIGSVGAAAYVAMSGPKPVTVGVKVGDTFIYSIKGMVDLTGLNAVPTPGFDTYNQTDYYKVTITAVDNTSVTMDTTWRFLNGTELKSPQTLNLANGNKTDNYGFWALYASNLQKTNRLRPEGADGNIVNNTYSAPYSSGNRTTNFWFINNEFQDQNDPTGSTLRYNYLNIYFDQPTGMLVTLQQYDYYNNPERQETVIWTLTNSTVWQV